jgi:pimeloyl-ACP methyl ester carboxylesterase
VNRRQLPSWIWFAAATLTPCLARAQTAAPFGFGESFASGDGARIYYAQSGSGPLIVFLHGHPDNWQLYEEQLHEFSRDHLVVAPNLRGYPPSDAPDQVEAYAMPRILGDLHGLLDTLNRQRCVLVGNDWGGYVSWVFASAYPARVEQLIILNAPHPALFLREVRTNPNQIMASQHERAFHAAIPPYPRWYNYYRADPIKIPSSITDVATMKAPNLSANFFAGVARPPATTSLRVTVPTLVIWGLRDTGVLPGVLDGLGEYVADLKVLQVPEAGHYPMRSHPGKVNEAIRVFLGRSN